MTAIRPTPGLRARRDQAIADAYAAGGSATDVAARVGVTDSTVLATLARLGLPRRPRGKRAKRSAPGTCQLCAEDAAPGARLCAHHGRIVEKIAADDIYARQGVA